ncbi:MAG: hypothetical protein BBJ57_04435 [Desulfobacterales bacterium PC51MH44]|nr:MAG: hypothetical protein BBJ57_04435 [Desulfobacterales bacterium PC51MH44]
MTKEKQPKPAKNQFLNDLRDELQGFVDQYLADYGPKERQHILENLYSLVEVNIKQSFLNGIEIGEKKAGQKGQKKSPKYRKAEKAIDDVAERQAQKDKQDNSRY